MKTITVQVQDDHLATLARTKPMNAMAELLWNALDADATRVRVEFETNEMDGLERIVISDNGAGLTYDNALLAFGNLGGSWKRELAKSEASQRVLHGQYGKGRFRAFSMGDASVWHSTYRDADGQLQRFSIRGDIAQIDQFELSDPKPVQDADAATGMRVEITRIRDAAYLLRGVKAQEEVTAIFAPYLRQYPGVQIQYDGVPLDPANAERHTAEYDLGDMITQNGERMQAVLSVVEWNMRGKRGVLLCDEHGFMRHNALPRLHFRGFSYTAYVRSAHVAQLDREGLLQTEDLSDDVRQLLDAARAQLREHFAIREAELARDAIALWQEMDIYPYSGQPSNDSEANERRIFDIYATHLNQIFPDFANAPHRQKRLTLRMIQELVRTDPTRVARLLDELLHFPEEKEEEVLELISG